MNVFLDSSYLIALIYKEDINHLAAKKLFEKYSDSYFYVDDIVKYESINVTLKKADIKTAKFLNSWLEKGDLITISLNSYTWDNAFKNIISKYSKSGPNIFDYIHFACMSEYNLKDVLTFDKHFASAGFNVLK